MQLAVFLRFQEFFFFFIHLVLLYLEHTFEESFLTGKENEPKHAHWHVINKGVLLTKFAYFRYSLETLDLMVTVVHSETHWPVFCFMGPVDN